MLNNYGRSTNDREADTIPEDSWGQVHRANQGGNADDPRGGGDGDARKAVELVIETDGVEKQKPLLGIASVFFVVGYFGLTVARASGWIPPSWSLLPVVETAWLNFLLILAALIWMRTRKVPLAAA